MTTAVASRVAAMGSGRRPPAVRQPPLPPFDADDPGGRVHTTFPPELHIPVGPARGFFRGDLGGVTLPVAPPFVDGANTTPPEMTMSYLLPKYVRFGTAVIDAILTAHAQRSYTHFHLDRGQADMAGLSDTQFVDLIEYVQSWGFYTSCWITSSGDNRCGGWATIGARASAFLTALLARSARTLDRFIALPGGELNNACPPGPDGADGIIRQVCSRVVPHGIPVWLHFTANYPGYPENPPDGNIDQALIAWWQAWEGTGVTGLCWQGDQDEPAGLMGARMWDARRILGWASPTAFTLVAFELLATNQLYGRATEGDGCLRGYEMLCCDNDGTGFPGVAGLGNGGRLPAGDPI